MVKESSNVTINGDLIIDSCTNNGLILCKGATLTVTGALIHKGGTFPIYGVSDNGKNAGRLVIQNSSGNGAAIRSAAADSELNIGSGELEIYGGSSQKLVDGVKLYSENKAHTAALGGKQVLPLLFFLGTRNQRKHERPDPPVVPEGDRLHQSHHPGNPEGRRLAERLSPRNPWLPIR